MARLGTHVLDTARGKPASGVRIDLYSVSDEARVHLKTVVTNDDGRTDEPLMSSDTIPTGAYQLEFHAGDYLRSSGVTLPDVAFLEVIVIRFGIGDASGHYHVPLLLSPYGYSTYRGS
jgi:5-hydroxyisourate hydrolase